MWPCMAMQRWEGMRLRRVKTGRERNEYERRVCED